MMIGSKEKKLVDFDEIIIEKFVDNSDCVVFFFSAYDKDIKNSNKFNFYSQLKALSCSVVLIRDLNCSWYHFPHRDKNIKYDFICERLKSISALHKRSICIGSSMGGTGALFWGSIIKADLIVSFAPFIATSLSKLKKINDHRFSDEFKNIDDICSGKSVDIDNIDFDKKQEIHIFIGDQDPLDASQVNLLPKEKNINIHIIKHFGHGIISAMSKSGALNKIINDSISGEKFPTDIEIKSILYDCKRKFSSISFLRRGMWFLKSENTIRIPVSILNNYDGIWGGGAVNNINIVSRIREVNTWIEKGFFHQSLGEQYVLPTETLDFDIQFDIDTLDSELEYEIDVEVWLNKIELADLGFNRLKIRFNLEDGISKLDVGSEIGKKGNIPIGFSHPDRKTYLFFHQRRIDGFWKLKEIGSYNFNCCIMRTDFGNKSKNYINIPYNKKGVAIYGPYIGLSPGLYYLKGEFDEGLYGSLVLDVVDFSNGGEKIFCSRKLVGNSLYGEKVGMFFYLEDYSPCIEIRILSLGECSFVFKSFNLKKFT